MTARAPLAAAALAALALAGSGCDRSPAVVAAAHAQRTAPDSGSPIGPVPGRGEPAARENPLGSDPAVLSSGRGLFESMNCAGCHGTHAGGGMGPSLRDEAWIYGGDPGHIFDSIARGRANGMPAWGTLLPEQLIWQLTAYIQSLRTPNEPEPPI